MMRNHRKCIFKHTSWASTANEISSSQTLDQNSIPCRATLSSVLFMAWTVIWTIKIIKSKKIRYYRIESVHVRFHELVVESHNPNKTLKSRNFDLRVWGLRSLTNHLHDDVSLVLQNKYNKISWNNKQTSFWKLLWVNSKAFPRALVAAKRTWFELSSFLIPCTIAVKIWLAWLSRT